MKCDKCGHENPSSRLICESCGGPLAGPTVSDSEMRTMAIPSLDDLLKKDRVEHDAYEAHHPDSAQPAAPWDGDDVDEEAPTQAVNFDELAAQHPELAAQAAQDLNLPGQAPPSGLDAGLELAGSESDVGLPTPASSDPPAEPPAFGGGPAPEPPGGSEPSEPAAEVGSPPAPEPDLGEEPTKSKAMIYVAVIALLFLLCCCLSSALGGGGYFYLGAGEADFVLPTDSAGDEEEGKDDSEPETAEPPGEEGASDGEEDDGSGDDGDDEESDDDDDSDDGDGDDDDDDGD